MTARRVARIGPSWVAEEADDSTTNEATLDGGVVDAERRPQILGGTLYGVGGVVESLTLLHEAQSPHVIQRALGCVNGEIAPRRATHVRMRLVRRSVEHRRASAVRVHVSRLASLLGYYERQKRKKFKIRIR